MNLKRALGMLASAVVPVVIAAVEPATVINGAVGGAVKHLTPINNNTIPFLNVLASSGFYYIKTALATGDWAAAIGPAVQQGIMLAGGSTLLHQGLKIPVKYFTATADKPGGFSI